MIFPFVGKAAWRKRVPTRASIVHASGAGFVDKSLCARPASVRKIDMDDAGGGDTIDMAVDKGGMGCGRS